jgi:hypothetical protein
VQISEFDKKRILHAIDNELGKMGMTKSNTPDLLVNIFTKEEKTGSKPIQCWMGLRMGIWMESLCGRT